MATNIKSWYSGKNVFITGGSGFLGICLLEKLLRTIPDIGTIYLLLRPKRGKEINQRLEEIKKNLVFEKLFETTSVDEAFKNVKCVAGDVGQPDLGLSPEDRKMLKDNVNVIFHSAATLDFAESLKTTVDINLLGTRRCLQLGKECTNLKVFIHVSSAYVNSWALVTEEIVYPLKQDVEKLIKLTETLSSEELESQTPEILGDHPNTYTITKQMAEHEVQACQDLFPCTIVRPSMIIGAWKEPIPGWTISKNGAQGFLMGAAKGVVRRLPVGKEIIYDNIPVDIVVNELIAAGFHAAVTEAKEVQVYHCTSSTCNPFRWATVEDKVNVYLHRYPLKSAVWYPHLKFLPTLTWFKFSAIFVHIIPAMFLDLLTRIFGGRPILVKLHNNISSSLDRLSSFIFTEWKFHNDKTMALQKWLKPEDQKDFNLDISELLWIDYFEDLTKGARRYLNKENMKNIEAARGKDTLLMVFHLILQGVIYCMVWYTIATCSGLSMTSTAFIVPLTIFLCSYI
ncbi:PREDICTED: putative fatty acyl-CoA reductase CG8306 isoform X2 [Nicrophorus vespilloides]|nr:PREDICTED: putative fatty acyl-CoA reductase CG8306 isoform X2 [Nicrophorus vespilloides]